MMEDFEKKEGKFLSRETVCLSKKKWKKFFHQRRFYKGFGSFILERLPSDHQLSLIGDQVGSFFSDEKWFR